MLLTPGGVAVLAAALSGCPAPAELPAPPANRPFYVMTISIGAGKKVVQGTSRVSFALDRPADRVVFRLWPNSPVQRDVGASLGVRDVRIGGAAVQTETPDPTTLELERPLAAGERVTVSMKWTLNLPRESTERLATGLWVRLSSFFPLLAWSGTDWALDPPAPFLETWTSPTSDFDVRVTTPKGMRVFASGASSGNGRWRATAVRDFALVAGRFSVTRRTVRATQPVTVTAAVEGDLATPKQYLDAAEKALTTYSRRYASYPWRTLTVVHVTDRPGVFGEEYPTIVFVDSPGLVAHEVAHQWFYSLVGDDQARDPWLDEALAQWATARLKKTVAPEAATLIPDAVKNHLGEPMTFWGRLGFMPWTFDGVYEQGVEALASFGDDAAVDCALARYVHDNAYRTAVPRDLLAALTPTFPNAESVLAGFGVRF
jgi:Peptidase family M1 domain